MHVLVVQWVHKYDMSHWDVRSNPAHIIFFSSNDETLNVPCLVYPFIQNHFSHFWAIQPTRNILYTCFFKWKSLPLHDERRQMESHLWFCDRVMSYSQNYWGSNLVDCIFFFLMRQGKIEWGLSLKGEEMESELVSWKRSNIHMY